MTTTEAEALVSQDSFALPSDFLQGVFPDDDLPGSGNFLADLNLDHYFSSDLSFSELDPGSYGQGMLSRCQLSMRRY